MTYPPNPYGQQQPQYPPQPGSQIPPPVGSQYQPPGYNYPPPQPGYQPQPGYPPPQPGYQQWGGQQGFPPPPPAKSGRTGLIVTLVIIGVLIIGGGIVAVTFLVRGGASSPSGTPTEAVQTFLSDVFQSKDTGAAMGLVCSRGKTAVQTKLDSVTRPVGGGTITGVTWSNLRETKQGTKAVVTASAEWSVTGGQSVGKPVAFWAFGLEVDSSAWKICAWA